MRTFAEKNGCEESWETYIVKPGGILKKDVLTSVNLVLRPVMDCVGAISELFSLSFLGNLLLCCLGA